MHLKREKDTSNSNPKEEHQMKSIPKVREMRVEESISIGEREKEACFLSRNVQARPCTRTTQPHWCQLHQALDVCCELSREGSGSLLGHPDHISFGAIEPGCRPIHIVQHGHKSKSHPVGPQLSQANLKAAEEVYVFKP